MTTQRSIRFATALLMIVGLAASAVAQPLIPRRPTGPGDERTDRPFRTLYTAASEAQLQAVPSPALALECTGLSEATLRDIRSLPNLRELTIRGTTFTQSFGLQGVVAEVGRLERLEVYNCRGIGDDAISAVDDLDNLQVLRLRDLPDLTDAALMSLRRNSSIGRLDLRGCSALGNDAATHISQMRRVWSLDIGGTQIGDTGLRTLAGLAGSLKELLVDGNRVLTDAGMDNMRYFDRIDAVSIAGCTQFTDAAVTNIARRDSVRLLRLARCPGLTDAAVMTVASQMPNLEYLDVSGCSRLTDGTLRAVSRLWRKIVYLDVSATRISDGGLGLLVECCLLEWLRLDNLTIDGSGLEQLNNLPKLREVSVNGCQNLTLNELEDFKAAHVEVLEVKNCPQLAQLTLRDAKESLPRLLKLVR